MQLGHAARADGAWRLYAFADANAEKLGALMTFLEKSDQSPVRRYTPAEADIDSVIDVRAVFQQGHQDPTSRICPLFFCRGRGGSG